MIAGRPAATIALYHRRQVQPVDHLDDKPREMPLGKPFIERRRKQKPRRTVKLPEIAHQAHPAGESICAIIPGASIRQVRQAARGGLGNFPTTLGRPAGMPNMMMGFGPQEYVITPETTYILIGWHDHYRRIF